MKILRSVSQKWISQSSTKGDPLGQQGVESLRKKRPRLHPCPPPPPLNPLLAEPVNFCVSSQICSKPFFSFLPNYDEVIGEMATIAAQQFSWQMWAIAFK